MEIKQREEGFILLERVAKDDQVWSFSLSVSPYIYIFSFSLVLIFYLHLLYFLTCFLFYSFIVSFAPVFPLSLFSLSLADVQTPWWTNWSAYINVSLSFFLSLLQSLSLCNAHTKQLRDRKAGHSRQAPSHTHAKAWLACTCAEWQKEKDTDTRLCMQVTDSGTASRSKLQKN